LTEDLDKAEQYTKQAFNADGKPGTGLCQLWKRVQLKAPREARASPYPQK